MADALAVLQDQGIKLRNATVGNHKAPCPACSHTRKKKSEPCLSVTIEDNGRVLWNCHHCGWSGAKGGEGYRPLVERRAYRKPERTAQPQQPDTLMAWFAKRGISEPVVRRMGIHKTRHFFPQTKQDEDCIAFPYEWAGELRNVKYRTAGKLFVQEKDPEPVFYNADAIRPDEDLIITEGEMDVLAFLEAGFERVVTLPNGAPQTENDESDRRYEPLATHWDAVSDVSRFLIATDMDEKGGFLAQELARRIGRDRCWRVRMPNLNDHQTKDANDCLLEHGAKVLRECVELAQPWPIDGLHDAEDYSVEVLDLYLGNGPKPLSTGFKEMDLAFRYIPGQFIVVTGVPNHGKSRWVDQVAVQTARLRDEKWVMFSPETGEANHLADLAEIWAGSPFFEGPTFRMSSDEVSTALAWINERIFFIASKEHTPTVDWVLERARAAVVRHGVTNLVIDPYNELEASRPDRQTETEFVSQLISKCKRFAQHHGCTVWMVVHPTKMKATDDGSDPVPGLYDLSGSAHWRNKADAGLVVYRDYEAASTHVIAKKIRRQPQCGKPGSVKFSFNGVDRRFHDTPGSFANLGTAA